MSNAHNAAINPAILNCPLKIMHIISGDLWAGAEAQAFTLLTSLKSITQLHVVLMNNGILAERLQKSNISISIIDETKLGSMAIICQLSSLIRQFNPDIIHTHRQKENIFGSIANIISQKSLKHRHVSVRTCHGAPEFKPSQKQRIQIWLDNAVGNYFQDAVIAVSAELKTKLASIFPEKKVYFIRNGINKCDIEKNNMADEFHSGSLHIGIIGRLEPVKRIDIFIKAAHIIHTRTQLNCQFHIIGEGKLKPSLEELSKNLNLTTIHFHGHRNDIPQCLKALDYVIMCSDHEGTPMTALESLAMGKPLIAHNVGGLTELLRHLPQLLVENHTPEGYAEKIMELVNLPAINAYLPSEYTAEANAAETLKLYKQLCRQ